MALSEDSIILVDKGKTDYVILINSKASEVESFAASQMQSYIQKVSGVKVPIKRSSEEAEHDRLILIGRSLMEARIKPTGSEHYDPDEFIIKTVGDNLIIAGGSDRGTLNGVYTFLEYLGLRWPIPGAKETVPRKDTIRINGINMRDRPSFSWRSLDLSGHKVLFDNKKIRAGWIREVKIFFDWMAKNKLNNVFLSHVPPDIIHEILPEIKKRGMTLECGGHMLPYFLPRKYFDEHPDYFRFWQGTRRRDGNFCGSNEAAMSIVRDNALNYYGDNSECQVFHMFASDVVGGAWCECDKCKGLTPAEQLLNVVNKIGEDIYSIDKKAKITFIAYHDTIHGLEKVKPFKNVLGLYAPRPRCYAHPINSGRCQRNKGYRENLERLFKIFGDRVYVFEYYMDAILFRTMAVPLTKVIQEDLRYYEQLGIRKVMALALFGAYAAWAYSINFYVFSKICWNAHGDLDDILIDYFKSLYGEAHHLIRIYYNKLEEAMAARLDYSEEVQGGPIAGIERALEILSQCEGILKEANRLAENRTVKENIKKCKDILLYTQAELKAICHQLRGHREIDEARQAISKDARIQYITKASEDLYKAISLLDSNVDFIKTVKKDVRGVYTESMYQAVPFKWHHYQMINTLLQMLTEFTIG